MRSICVIGAGYVGLTAAACLAEMGNKVVCVDVDCERIASLERGDVPIYEPGLTELLQSNTQTRRLRFTTQFRDAVPGAEYVFIAVGTPSRQDGEADLRHVRGAIQAIAESMTGRLIVVNKSTMPIGSGNWVARTIEHHNNVDAAGIVVANPEFMREGSAVHDFLHPDRIVLGADVRWAAEEVADLYRPLGSPILITDLRTAEMIKYASNAFLATKVSFINEIAQMCDQLGADVKEVARGMGLDRRIGNAFLDAGIGWGGSCFPKDVKALEYMASMHGCHPQLLRAVMEINRDQRRLIVQRLRLTLGALEGAAIGVLGLSFKPNTDDLREAPALEIIHLLREEGAQVRAYDPIAMPRAEQMLSGVRLCEDPYETVEGADAVVVATEWDEFRHLDLERLRDAMRRPLLVDGRNMYDPLAMRVLGFDYHGIGRGVNGREESVPRQRADLGIAQVAVKEEFSAKVP